MKAGPFAVQAALHCAQSLSAAGAACLQAVEGTEAVMVCSAQQDRLCLGYCCRLDRRAAASRLCWTTASADCLARSQWHVCTAARRQQRTMSSKSCCRCALILANMMMHCGRLSGRGIMCNMLLQLKSPCRSAASRSPQHRASV